MASKYFFNKNILKTFRLEYMLESKLSSWKKFIESKDLGIICVSYSSLDDEYEIIDEKKWLLSKLKYGF